MTAVNRACLRDTGQLLPAVRLPNAFVNASGILVIWAFSSNLSGAPPRRASVAQLCAASRPEAC